MDEQWEERRQPLVRVTRILEQTADGRHVTLRLQFRKDYFLAHVELYLVFGQNGKKHIR